MTLRAKIAAQVFAPARAIRNLVDEPLTADDWRKVWNALQAFRAAVRQIVFEARCRAAARPDEQTIATEAAQPATAE